MALFDDLDTLKNFTSNLSTQVGNKTRTYNELQALRDSVLSAEIVICNREFTARQDASSIMGQLASLAKATISNLHDLEQCLLMIRQSDRSAEDVDVSRVQDIRYTMLKHTKAFQKVTEFVQGREDWTNMARKPPVLSRPSLDLSSQHLQPREPSHVSVSTPTTPLQATVEDFEGSEDEEVSTGNVEEYHWAPDEHLDKQVVEAQAPQSRMDSPHRQTDSPKGTESPRRKPVQDNAPLTPPQILLRQATDTNVGSDSPRLREEPRSSPLQYSSFPNDVVDSTTAGSESKDETLPSSDRFNPTDLSRLDRHEQTVQELQEKIQRLEAEHEAIRVGRSTAQASEESHRRKSKSRRRHHTSKHRSVDLRHEDDYPHADLAPSRPRASTSVRDRPRMGERPRSYIETSSSEDRRRSMRSSPREAPRDSPRDEPLRRTLSARTKTSPGQSPRPPKSAYSRTDPQVNRAGPFDDYATETYGTSGRRSLPAVVEPERNGTRPRRNTRTLEPNMFQEFGDDELFSSTPIDTRPRAGSRTQSMSPASQMPTGASPRANLESVPEVGPTVRELPVTLEELFYGTQKKVRIKRLRYNTQIGRFLEEERILDVPIYKGLKPGSKVKFQNEGDETLDGIRELHFVLLEKTHQVYTRKNYDLHMSLDIPLLDALCGWQRNITSICGKSIRIGHQGPTPANWAEPLAGLGMCSHKNQSQRGDLIVGINIRYPGPLSDRQKMLLREALGGR